MSETFTPADLTAEGRWTAEPVGDKIMVIAKAEALKLVDQMPDQFDLEELQYRLYLRQKIEAAEEDFRAGGPSPMKRSSRRPLRGSTSNLGPEGSTRSSGDPRHILPETRRDTRRPRSDEFKILLPDRVDTPGSVGFQIKMHMAPISGLLRALDDVFRSRNLVTPSFSVR